MAALVHRSVPSPRLPNRRNPAAKVVRTAAAAPAAAVLVLVEMVLILVEMVLVLAAADRAGVARVVVVDQVEADLEVAEDRAGVVALADQEGVAEVAGAGAAEVRTIVLRPVASPVPAAVVAIALIATAY